MHPYHHSLSSTKKWGGTPEDYLLIHQWFDESKAYFTDLRHRALRHHAEGIFLCEAIFGPTITNSSGRVIPTRWIGEQHVWEDLGFIPTVQDWLRNIKMEAWMLRVAVKESDLARSDTDNENRPEDLLCQPPLTACVTWPTK